MPIEIVDRLISHAELIGNVDTEFEYSGTGTSPVAERVTFPDGVVYRRTFSYDTNSPARVTKRSRWEKQ